MLLKLNKIYNENCLDMMSRMPDNFIDCCVTSPPYYGLRDYGHPNQIGLEETPEKYVEKLVQVFAEVKRVLKKEGVCWLNLGDSYYGSKQVRNGDGTIGKINSKKQASNVGSLNDRHEVSYDTCDKEPEGYLMNGCFSQNLCDECQQDYHFHNSHNDHSPFAMQSVLLFSQIREYMEEQHDHFATSDFLLLQQILQSFFSNQDLRHFANLEVSQIDVFLQTNFVLFFQQFQDLYSQTSNNVLTHLLAETLIHCVQEFGNKLHHELLKTPYYKQDSVLLSEVQGQNNQYISGYCSQCGSYSHTLKTYIQPQSYKEFSNLPKTLKPKDLIGIPWMVAFALRADGWYLRQDIIWHKPNPMPESVTDRCTKSHEYIFLLSKSARYYYDYKSISERSEWFESDKRSINGYSQSERALNGPYQCNKQGVYNSDGLRNKRSVWTVTTKSFSEAHFATFPEDLIVPCIKAGSPEGGIVYDPFMGAGTTALVSHKLNRKFIGSEISAEYVKIAEKRIQPYLMQQKLF
jgi:DNA modification methylase